MAKRYAKAGPKADSRRSTAAQFFMDEEDQENEPKQQTSTHDKVVELINQAAIMQKDTTKVHNLKQVQELIIHKDPNLLDNFLDEMLAFQHDKSTDVRKFVVGFIEEACKKDPDILPKVVANINMMLVDESVIVRKKVIQAASRLYKIVLQWLSKAKTVDDIMESTWAYISQLKTRIVALLDSDNDGIRTQTIKFMEMLVLTQTYPDPDSPKKGENDFSLEDVPPTLKVPKIRKLEEEAEQTFESLVIYHGTAHISSVNLMTCMQTLALIARNRSEFMSKVIQALEALHANLPPTLAKSQVSSVRKHLKLQLLTLLKHPASVDYHSQISTLLTDLGATSQEISKCMPKPEELKKRARLAEEVGQSSKRVKIETELEDEKEEEETLQISKAATNTAIDITAEDVLPRLNPVNVTDLVLVSMLSLPESMPAHFQASYTPISVAGTEGQIRHLARLIATQMTAGGIGKGVEEMVQKMKEETEEEERSAKQSIKTVLGGTTSYDQQRKERVPVTLMPTGAQVKGTRRPKQLNLVELTKPLTSEQAENMANSAMRRILTAEKTAATGGASQVRIRILANLAAQFKGNIADMLLTFVLEDVRTRADLAFAWLYEEYATSQGFNQLSHLFPKTTLECYDTCLCNILQGLLSKVEPKDRDVLFSRFFLEIPCITKNALAIFRQYCQEEETIAHGLVTLKAIVEKRPPLQMVFLSLLMDLTLNGSSEVRTQAVKIVQQLHERGDLRPLIETFALKSLKYLLEPAPPADLLLDLIRPLPSMWTEECTKQCLHLYLSLLPLNHKLIHDLAAVYVGTIADIKRTILRVLENPVKGMGMGSPELLLLVENCPKGAETLVTRIIHILTDKAPPSGELVARVRDLYHKRVPDVRFLIPVLNGLSKKEVIAALPKLIKLNPIVVKEVFNRLLGSHESGSSYTSPLTPAELLIVLHNIDPSKCDMKTIIKATSLCFAEKHVYTQEVLAVVMQHLMEQNPLPTLLMRTVIQSFSLYPRLIGFVMNILQRLILKQVWKQKKVWEGFIKCCQRTKPQSFQALLQLPLEQLNAVFEVSPDLREPLAQHITSLTEHQREHIPQEIVTLLLGAEEDRVHAEELEGMDILEAGEIREVLLPPGMADMTPQGHEIRPISQ